MKALKSVYIFIDGLKKMRDGIVDRLITSILNIQHGSSTIDVRLILFSRGPNRQFLKDRVLASHVVKCDRCEG